MHTSYIRWISIDQGFAKFLKNTSSTILYGIQMFNTTMLLTSDVTLIQVFSNYLKVVGNHEYCETDRSWRWIENER